MGIEWFEVEGVVEVLGDAQVHPRGRTLSVLKLRTDDGRLASLDRLHALERVSAVLHPGHRVRLLGWKAAGEHQALAARTPDEAVDDADLLAAASRHARLMRLAALGLVAFPFLAAAVEPYGAPVAALFAWAMAALVWIAHGRRAALLSSRDEIVRRAADFTHAGRGDHPNSQDKTIAAET